MIQVATIVPSSLLRNIFMDDYHMALAQFIGVDKLYTSFYQGQKAKGRFVLLDNGAAEGEQPTAEELIPKIELLRPTEVILPDTIYKADETLRKAEEAIILFREHFGNGETIPFRLMAVPQGETFIEYLECARQLLQMPEISSLGISKFITPRYGDEARYYAVQSIRVMEHEYDTMQHDIHLLGCWNSPVEIGAIQRDFEIRGCDSAIAYVYAKAGLELNDLTPRPKVEIDFINGTIEDEGLLERNIKVWQNQCKGV